MNETFEPKRRMGRGKFVSVERRRRDNPRSAELDPETTRSTEQTLTEISLKSANSDSNAAILREREKTADRCDHIKSGLPAKQKAVLLKVLDVVEAADSLREIGRKAGLHATQVSRAFEAAREADKRRIFFKPAGHQRRAYKPYNPRCVPMETVMMPHQGPILYTIKVPDRLNGTAPPVNKCSHPRRQWRLICLDCKADLQSSGN
jgi:DNA-binding phage protein